MSAGLRDRVLAAVRQGAHSLRAIQLATGTLSLATIEREVNALLADGLIHREHTLHGSPSWVEVSA